ncbi:hypothetical protein STH12_01299 [Shewanella khirikhana]|uniref:Uncharacterized protein n=1 Tax=Shewanella khirikhana TaxID=1965282 RepID=A0ABN5TTK4_9GAMM|nr:hypothetical protein STH12_01299 [Shewanella khirikhana]
MTMRCVKLLVVALQLLAYNKLLKFTPPAEAGSVGLARRASLLTKRYMSSSYMEAGL